MIAITRPWTRGLIAALIVSAVLAALYVIACLHILSKLDARSLITHYIALPHSQTSPIAFPVVRPITEVHWKFTGHATVRTANQRSNKSIEYLAERIVQATERSEQIDDSRAHALLRELVCEKIGDSRFVLEMQSYYARRNNAALETAVRNCLTG